MLVVTDTGVGIAADQQLRIFERFERVINEQSEQITGAGIGLALVKEMVETHQGSIEVSSTLGEGAIFTVCLPIIGEVNDAELANNSNDEIIAMELMNLSELNAQHADQNVCLTPIEGNQTSVLVIEDNRDMRDYIVDALSDTYSCLAANNGLHGLAIAKEEIPDIVICDVMMPEMDGYETTNALRNNEKTCHIPVILLTARSDRESRLMGWYQKADEYITKPFDVEELLIRINNLLSIRAILRKRFSETAFLDCDHKDKNAIDLTKNDPMAVVKLGLSNHLDYQILCGINDYLREHCSINDLKVIQIAKHCAMSERQFSRKLKAISDLSPVEYLRRFRLETAAQLLKQGNHVGHVIDCVGFSSQSYFGKCFKAHFGCAIKEYIADNS